MGLKLKSWPTQQQPSTNAGTQWRRYVAGTDQAKLTWQQKSTGGLQIPHSNPFSSEISFLVKQDSVTTVMWVARFCYGFISDHYAKSWYLSQNALQKSSSGQSQRAILEQVGVAITQTS